MCLKQNWSLEEAGAAALPLHGEERPEGGKPFSDQALAIRAIKCHKGIWWMPWR